MNPGEMNLSLFAQLVVTLATSCLQHLGKLVNPMTRKAETNLEAAQATIDLLDMLQTKTKGNLDKDEDKMLRDTVTALKMNFVETSQAAPQQPPEAPPPAPDAKAQPDVTAGPAGSDAQPKYHKKYE